MGMYTELIFGARLKKDTPNEVISTLQYMINPTGDKPLDFQLPDGRYEHLFTMSSYYFGVQKSVREMWYDSISKSYHISTRSNTKNYGNEIETFLEWIKPYIDCGSGLKDMYAVVMYEEDETPSIYYLSKTY